MINNSDPRLPVNIAFLRVPGNVDLGMKGDIIYADSDVDLVAMDVSNPAALFVAEQLENIYLNEPLVEVNTFGARRSIIGNRRW